MAAGVWVVFVFVGFRRVYRIRCGVGVTDGAVCVRFRADELRISATRPLMAVVV